MLKQVLKFSWMFALMGVFAFSACERENLTNDEDLVIDYLDEALFHLQSEGNLGRFGCFELVFPVTLEFPDESTFMGDSYEELIQAIQDWKEANPDVEGRPTFVFPIEVISEEGEVISVNSKEELHELREECGGHFGGHGHHGHHGNCTPCFEIIFPVTIQFPDETTADAADRIELKNLIREWKQANPDAEERPELVFPIEVEMEDGTIVTVNSKEELQELRESCND